MTCAAYANQTSSRDWPEQTVNTLIQRFFERAFEMTDIKNRGRHKTSLSDIKTSLREAVQDCTYARSQSVGYKIDNAKTPAELWALRSDLHQCIAQHHSERVAAARINDLAILFEGWLPASQLTRIQPGFRTSEK
jgi:hypothetical protein